jgi:hypothetical protein
VKRRAAARYTRSLVTDTQKLQAAPLFSVFFKFGQIWRADFWSVIKLRVTTQLAHPSTVRAQSSPPSLLPTTTAVTLAPCPAMDRAPQWTAARVPDARLFLSVRVVCACSSCLWATDPCLRVPLLCVGSRHAWPSGARQPHDHVRASPAPNAAGA